MSNWNYNLLYEHVIDQALEDLLDPSQQIRVDARTWLFSHSMAPLSFRSMCEFLGWDPQIFLRRVCDLNLSSE